MVNLERPTAATGAILGGGLLTTSGSDYYFKVEDGDFDHMTRWFEVTGDGDTAPTHEPNLYLYGTYRLRGFMVASQAMGLAPMINSSKNPLASSWTFDWGGTRQLTATIGVRRIRVRWNRSAAYVGVALDLITTDSHPTEGSA